MFRPSLILLFGAVLGPWVNVGLVSAEDRTWGLLSESQRFAEFCSWSPAELKLLQDLDDDHLDSHSLLGAALVVSGYSENEIAKLKVSFDQSCARCRTMTRVLPTARVEQRLRQLFEYLLSNHLYGEYQPDLCDVGKTISRGDFNCLTATILFRALCAKFDIEVVAAWEPAHVRCWVPTEAGAVGYLVETTADNPTAGVSALFPQNKLAQRKLSAEQLLGKVFYNRGVQALEKHQYPLALTSTWASCLLDDQDSPAANNLRACLNNWALVAARKQNVAQALRLLDAGLQLDPSYRPFSRNRKLLERN